MFLLQLNVEVIRMRCQGMTLQDRRKNQHRDEDCRDPGPPETVRTTIVHRTTISACPCSVQQGCLSQLQQEREPRWLASAAAGPFSGRPCPYGKLKGRPYRDREISAFDLDQGKTRPGRCTGRSYFRTRQHDRGSDQQRDGGMELALAALVHGVVDPPVPRTCDDPDGRCPSRPASFRSWFDDSLVRCRAWQPGVL